ncbi:unnamed protein product [Prorocentrum cordatum]|uniref:Uncharacterized protein n=1 Tax=Prorocentrum cordatum TaxID=2364126 RepID=A0ABN9SNW0_9DINO|nr:unnamed protein product [Polarella glacialis]
MHKRVKPNTFVNYMKRKTATVEHGCRVKEDARGAPKVNFPGGLPEGAQQFEKQAEELEELSVVGGGPPDHETYFFVDQQRARKKLGPGVKTMEFFVKSATRMPSDAAAGPPVASDAGGPGEVRSPQQDSGAWAGRPSPGVAAGAKGNPLKRRSSDEADGEAPAAKRARFRLQTLRDLRGNIKSAVQAGHWTSTNALHTTTVCVHVRDAHAILKELGAEADAKEAGLVTKFTNFLARTFLAAPGFEHLHLFKGTFTSLKELGGQETGEGKLLEALAVIDASSDAALDWSQADAVARVAFRSSAMHKSFVAARVEDKVRQARLAGGQRRLDILLGRSIDSAIALFDVRVPLGIRIKHFVLSPPAVKLAREWDPDGTMGAAALVLMETPDVKDVAFDAFVEVARAVAEEGVDVPNPVLKSAVGFVKAVSPNASEAGQGWASRLLQESFKARSLSRVSGVDAAFDPVAVGSGGERSADACRATKEFLLFLPKGATVDWLQVWKKHRDEEKAKQAREKANGAGKGNDDAKGEHGESADKDAKGDKVDAAAKGGVAAEEGGQKEAGAAAMEDAAAKEGIVPNMVGAAGAQGAAEGQAQGVQKIGDAVIGKSHQQKDKFSDEECEATRVLTNHYKVELLTGAAANTPNNAHKYLFKDVRAKPSGSGLLRKLAGKAAAPAKQAQPGKGDMQEGRPRATQGTGAGTSSERQPTAASNN